MISGISSVDAFIHELIRALTNSAPAALFTLLVTEILDAHRKLAGIFQEQITGKTKLETDET